MKLSVAWIFSHIKKDWKKIDIKNLIDLFNKTTAEIESFKKVSSDLNKLFIGKLVTLESENVILYCPELKKEIELPKRDNLKKDKLYLINKNDKDFKWTKTSDLGSDKEMLLPALDVDENLINGDWKKTFESEDYILEIDNKSITHRPDLWGSRGIAREIAAILDLELLPIEEIIIGKQILAFKDKSDLTTESPFEVSIKESNLCKRFASFYIGNFEYKPSNLFIATRLARIDSKPINAIVDATNYVMFDISQPMHAFDAAKIKGNTITPRLAYSGERLTLLDDQTIELTATDLIIADQSGPIALAGIMGGKTTQVDESSKSLLIESANFNATQIRLSALKHKIRTESSARFEKSLDPNQNTMAIERFLKILEFSKIKIDASNSIISLGTLIEENKITVNNDFIEQRLGTEIDEEFVVKTLKKLDFKLNTDNGTYHITAPTFRSTKDILIPEDIVEEIGRFFGYGNIPFVLPTKQMVPSDLKKIMTTRKIKQTMAYACEMHEVQNYPFYDESFLKDISWSPSNSISVLNPVSENWKILVTSLIPHLFKNIQQNLSKNYQLNFFEFNRIWNLVDNNPIEKKSLAGIFFNDKHSIDFYESKSKLEILFELLKIKVNWNKYKERNSQVWYDKNLTAELISNNKIIGRAGKASQEFLNKFINGDAFIFEIDGDYLIEYSPQTVKFKHLSKYQNTWLDISMFVSLENTVEEIIDIIKKSDSKIYKVELIDKFEKDEWLDKKSLTFRYYFIDDFKTMSKEDIDEVLNKVESNIKKIGAELR